MALGYRLVKREWVESAFTGEGARRYGGRWNGKGSACIYLAASESLALLEVMVHLDSYALLRHYSLFRVEIPDGAIEIIPPERIPPNWRDDAAPEETALGGNVWLERDVPGLALAVPSVIVPREMNYILNPSHPGYGRVVGEAQELEFEPDPRLAAG